MRHDRSAPSYFVFVLTFVVMGLQVEFARAAIPSQKLEDVRRRILAVQKSLTQQLRVQKQTQTTVNKIKELMQLQGEERSLGRKRVAELNQTIKELEMRRGTLRDRIDVERKRAREHLKILERTLESRGELRHSALESPRQKVLAHLVAQNIRELEALQIDLSDAYALEQEIEREKQRLAYLIEDLEEKRGILELNRQLQADVLQRNYEERLGQLEEYRKLKESEARVEQMMVQFNARKELEESLEAEREVREALSGSAFLQQKGKLKLPLNGGVVVSAFGKGFDPKSKLNVFRKGIEILGGAGAPVSAVSAGRLAYSGELPDYGKVAIIDHGDHYFSLLAHLGSLSKATGEAVKSGEAVGTVASEARPIYFEIRQKNLPVNPLQWIEASVSLK